MSAIFDPLEEPIWSGFDKPTSSPESGDGPSPSKSRGGLMIERSGPHPVPANHFHRPGNAKEALTSVISGQIFSNSSRSDALQSSLASRLIAKMAAHGSTEYELTWKVRVMPSGRPLLTLRASTRRISGSGCIGWRSPQKSDGEGGVMEIRPGGAGRYKLRDEAPSMGWPTPKKADGEWAPPRTSGRPKEKSTHLGTIASLTGWNSPRATEGTHGGPNQAGGALPADAALVGWATPTKEENSGSPEKKQERRLKAKAKWKGKTGNGFGYSLAEQAVLSGWPCPRKSDMNGPGEHGNGGKDLRTSVLGVNLKSSASPTAPSGVLAPEFPRWLMGFPGAWDDCSPNIRDWRKWQALMLALSRRPRPTESDALAVMETRSIRLSRRSSSAPISISMRTEMLDILGDLV